MLVDNLETFVKLEPSPNRIFLASLEFVWVFKLYLIRSSIVCGKNEFLLLNGFLHISDFLGGHWSEFDHCCFDQVFSSFNKPTSPKNHSQIEYPPLEG